MSVARIEPGSSALMLGSRSRTLFATSTAFAPACRVTATTDVADGMSYPRRHRRRIGLDAHGGLAAEDAHAAHAGQDADALPDLGARVIVEPPRRGRVAGQGDVHDRLIVRVRLRERGR